MISEKSTRHAVFMTPKYLKIFMKKPRTRISLFSKAIACYNSQWSYVGIMGMHDIYVSDNYDRAGACVVPNRKLKTIT